MASAGGISVRLDQEAPVPLAAALACGPGEVLAIVGPSGSGKTTLLRSIAGVARPRAGRIECAGEVWLDRDAGIELAPHRRRVGFVFQSYALFPHMTALGNVTASLSGLPAAERDRRARAWLEKVHLGGLERRKPAALSGGQQQRVAVARALARDPKVLLLDEPFAAVDRVTRHKLHRELAELRRELRMPVLLVTHDLDEAAMLADRMCILHRGRTLQTGAPAEVMTRPRSVEVARLVDLQNIFEAAVVAQRADPALTIVEWRGHRLEARAQPGFAPGARVSWVVPPGFVVLHRRDRPSRGEHENPIGGVVQDLIAFGETAHIKLRVADGEEPIHFSVPTHVARRNGIEPGVRATVSLLAEGIHLMPPTS
jgi:molybdate transport system ATP-binding protein